MGVTPCHANNSALRNLLSADWCNDKRDSVCVMDRDWSCLPAFNTGNIRAASFVVRDRIISIRRASNIHNILLTREHFTQTPLHTDYTLKTHLANLESDSKVITACCTRFYANIPDCTGNAWEVFVSGAWARHSHQYQESTDTPSWTRIRVSVTLQASTFC